MTAPRTEPVVENEIDRRARIRYNLQVVLKDASPEERKAYVDSEMVQAPKPEQGMGGAFRSIGQGLSFNFSDEAEAGLRALAPGRTYAGEKEKIDQSLSDFRSSDPKKALALELGGGLLSGGAIAKGATKGFKGLKSLAALSGSGAGAGAVAGAGAAEGGVGDRLKGGALGGVLGAGLGAVASRVPGAVSSFANKASRAGTAVANKGLTAAGLTPIAQSADQVAPEVEAIAKRLSTRGVDPAEISANAADVASVPEARIFDAAGREGQRHIRGMRALGGQASRTIDEALDAGHAAQRSSITDAVTQGEGRENVIESIDEMVKGRELRAAPFYEAARKAPPMEIDEQLQQILGSSLSKRALTNARAFPEYAGLPDNDMRMLDKVYKYLGDESNAAKISGLREKSRDLNNFRVSLRDKMVKHSPDYGEALSAFSSESELIDAMNMGRDLFAGGKIDPREIAKAVSGMGQGERDLLRRGAADGLLQSLDAAPDHLDLTRRINSQAFRDKVTAVWGDEASGMLDKLGKIRDKGEVRRIIQGGSQTADKVADAADAAGENFVDNVVGGGGWTGAAMKFGRDKLARPVMAKFGADDRAAQAGFYSQPITNEKALADLVREMQRQKSLKTPSAVARGVGGRLAGSTVNR